MQPRILPKFSKNQQVSFIGGTGKILNYQSESGTWSYVIEMKTEMSKPQDRVGCETIILLYEIEIQEISYS